MNPSTCLHDMHPYAHAPIDGKIGEPMCQHCHHKMPTSSKDINQLIERYKAANQDAPLYLYRAHVNALFQEGK